MTEEREPGSHRADIHTLADAITRVAAGYRRQSKLPADTPLTLGATEMPADVLEELSRLLARHRITIWTPQPVAGLIVMDALGPGEPLDPYRQSTWLLWRTGSWMAEPTAPIDLGGSA